MRHSGTAGQRRGGGNPPPRVPECEAQDRSRPRSALRELFELGQRCLSSATWMATTRPSAESLASVSGSEAAYWPHTSIVNVPYFAPAFARSMNVLFVPAPLAR